MKAKKENLFSGAGSLIDVFAASRYSELIPESTAEERIRGHWNNTGNYIRKAMTDFSDQYGERK